MQLREAIQRRRMVRQYDAARPVPRTVIDDLISLAVRAPSAGFTQGWHFVVLDTAQSRSGFWAATTDAGLPPDSWLRGMTSAPVLVVVLSDPQAYLDRYAEPDKGWIERDPQRWPAPYWDIDAGMASMLILLGIVDAGLSGCFFGVPIDKLPTLRASLGIPARHNVVGVISLGYSVTASSRSRRQRPRRALREVRSYETFAGH